MECCFLKCRINSFFAWSSHPPIYKKSKSMNLVKQVGILCKRPEFWGKWPTFISQLQNFSVVSDLLPSLVLYSVIEFKLRARGQVRSSKIYYSKLMQLQVGYAVVCILVLFYKSRVGEKRRELLITFDLFCFAVDGKILTDFIRHFNKKS